MNILEILPALGDPRGRSTTDWQCWPQDTVYVDWGGEENHLASVIVDPKTGEIYCMELYTGQSAVRYITPTLVEDFMAECQSRDIDPQWAAEDLQYTDVTDPQIILALLSTLPMDSPYDPT